ARANVLAVTLGDDQVFCVGTGVPTSVNEIYRRVCLALGLNVEPARAPRRPGDLRAAYFDVSAAQSQLGWAPTVSLEEGIARTVAFFRDQVPSGAGAA